MLVLLAPATANDAPVPVWLVPVRDYQEFLAQFNARETGIDEITLTLGTRMSVARKGQHAVLVDSRQRDALKKVLDSSRNLAGWSEPMQAWLAANDVVAAATPYGIKSQTSKLRTELAQARPNLAGDIAFVRRGLDALDGFLRSVETDVSHAAVGVRLDQAGNLLVEVRALFAAGSGLASTRPA